MGGAERQACLLSNEWVRAGYEVVILCASAEKSHYQLDERVHVERYRQGTDTGRLSRHLADFRDIRAAVRRYRPDVVLSFMDVTNLKVIAAVSPLGLPVVISERVVPSAVYFRSGGKLSGFAVAILRRLLYPRASALVVQSVDVAEWARRHHVSKQVRLIPNVAPAIRLLDRGPRANVILTVGRLTHQKGHDLVIRAFASIADEFSQWRVRIVGEGPLRDDLVKLAANLGVADRVELPGRSIEPEVEYESAGLFVLPSRFEGFPNALLEAMAAGCPVVASNCPGATSDILAQGKYGVLFRSEDSGDLTWKLREMLADPARRVQLAEQGRQSVQRYRSSEVLPLWDCVLQVGMNSGKGSGAAGV